MKLDLQRHPHRRFNPLTREWVLVSPQRTQRPWQGQIEKIPSEAPPQYDPNCYMCPANKRASGAVNPPYASTFVFDNDFPAMLPDTPALKEEQGGLLVAEGEPGLCRVICYSPRHDLTLSTLDEAAVAEVVDVWIAQFRELCARPGIRYVQIFENRGAMMGAILHRLTAAYDRLFETSFPYSMGFHQRPTDGPHPEWHLHAHFLPPLLRSATVRKFMVGYELLAMPQRDITPETAAARLREVASSLSS